MSVLKNLSGRPQKSRDSKEVRSVCLSGPIDVSCIDADQYTKWEQLVSRVCPFAVVGVIAGIEIPL